MPRAFLVKPRPVWQMSVTSEESSHDMRHASSVDASPWLQVDHDVNNNDVGRSSLTSFRQPSSLDLSAARSADDRLAGRPFDVAGGLRWWSMFETSDQSRTLPWRGPGHDVTSSAENSSILLPASAAAAATTTTDYDHVQPWWSSSPHSDVSASGIKLFTDFRTLSNEKNCTECN